MIAAKPFASLKSLYVIGRPPVSVGITYTTEHSRVTIPGVDYSGTIALYLVSLVKTPHDSQYQGQDAQQETLQGNRAGILIPRVVGLRAYDGLLTASEAAPLLWQAHFDKEIEAARFAADLGPRYSAFAALEIGDGSLAGFSIQHGIFVAQATSREKLLQGIEMHCRSASDASLASLVNGIADF